MSGFQEVFNIDTINDDYDLSDLVAVIRDKFKDKLNHYIPESSIMSSPECCLFAIYRLLENDLKDKKYISYEEIATLDNSNG